MAVTFVRHQSITVHAGGAVVGNIECVRRGLWVFTARGTWGRMGDRPIPGGRRGWSGKTEWEFPTLKAARAAIEAHANYERHIDRILQYRARIGFTPIGCPVDHKAHARARARGS